MFKKYLILTSLILSAGFLLGCEADEDNKVAAAQACLDAAEGTQAYECMLKVDGIETPEASRIRCGALYLIRGIGLSTFKTAYKQIKTPPAGQDATLALMSYVAFAPATTSVTGRTGTQEAAYLLSECRKANAPGLIFLAGITQMGTAIVQYGTGVNIGDPSTWQAADVNAVPDAVLGSTAGIIYESQCKTGSAAGSAACAEFAAAVAAAGTDPTALGAQIKTFLNSAASGG